MAQGTLGSNWAWAELKATEATKVQKKTTVKRILDPFRKMRE
jgi:hypothetical protein